MPKTKKHTKRSARKAVKTTSDLVIAHAERHLADNREISLGVLTFAIAGLVAVLSVFTLLNLSLSQQSGHETFMAMDATDYASQEVFYSGKEVMHSSAPYNMQAIQAKIRSAAQARELSKTFSTLGALLILGLLWYLHQEHGLLDRNRAGFRIRRIR